MGKEENILDKFFLSREEDLAEERSKDEEYFKTILKKVKQEDISKKLEEIPSEKWELKKELEEIIDDLIGNYNIKIAYYNKKYYQQGFRDAINLMCTLERK